MIATLTPIIYVWCLESFKPVSTISAISFKDARDTPTNASLTRRLVSLSTEDFLLREGLPRLADLMADTSLAIIVFSRERSSSNVKSFSYPPKPNRISVKPTTPRDSFSASASSGSMGKNGMNHSKIDIAKSFHPSHANALG